MARKKKKKLYAHLTSFFQIANIFTHLLTKSKCPWFDINEEIFACI